MGKGNKIRLTMSAISLLIALICLILAIGYNFQYEKLSANITDIDRYYGTQNFDGSYNKVAAFDEDLASNGKLFYVKELDLRNEDKNGVCYYADHVFAPGDYKFIGSFKIGDLVHVRIKDNRWEYEDNHLDIFPCCMLMGSIFFILIAMNRKRAY